MKSKNILVFAALAALLLLAPSPARASESTGLLYLDWSENTTDFSGHTQCYGAMVRLTPEISNLGAVYLDLGIDYNDTTVLFSTGLTLRSGRGFLFFHPYVGGGLIYDLADLPLDWQITPYVLFGADALWFFWEQELVFYSAIPEYVTRAGFRVKF